MICTYSRYVDDIFILTTDEGSANNIHTSMNSLHPSIRFEIKHPTDNTLRLLDVEVKVDSSDGSIQLQHFKKKARKEIFVNFNSAFPASRS